jgi:hypothetical protein
MDEPHKVISDEDVALLSQYLDGELAPEESRLLEARLSAEAELRSDLARLQELNQRLRDMLSERSTVPAEVHALLDNRGQAGNAAATGKVLRFPSQQPNQERRRKTDRNGPWPFAIAASVVVAVSAAFILNTSTTPESGLPGNDRLVSAALDRQTSGSGWADLGDGREIQPILTFPHQDGRWCREYLLRGGEADWRAVACRGDDRWVTQAAGLESYLDAGNAYVPAAANDAEPVAVFISQHAADIALDLEAETALLRDWK